MPHRFHVANLPETGLVTVDAAEAHHIIHVLRGAVGDIVELFDGCGLAVSAEITSVRRRDVELRIITARREARPARGIILGTAVPKGDRFDWLIEKATELGVTRIVPLVTTRSVVDPRDSKLDKLRQTVIAACKQSGRNHLLELSPVTAWNDFVTGDVSNHASFIAHPGPGAAPMTSSLLSGHAIIVFAIGPEGGFTDDEVALAVAYGAKPISLGPLTLRIETAALVLASVSVMSAAVGFSARGPHGIV